jgi:hypothetical protein
LVCMAGLEPVEKATDVVDVVDDEEDDNVVATRGDTNASIGDVVGVKATLLRTLPDGNEDDSSTLIEGEDGGGEGDGEGVVEVEEEAEDNDDEDADSLAVGGLAMATVGLATPATLAVGLATAGLANVGFNELGDDIDEEDIMIL